MKRREGDLGLVCKNLKISNKKERVAMVMISLHSIRKPT